MDFSLLHCECVYCQADEHEWSPYLREKDAKIVELEAKLNKEMELNKGILELISQIKYNDDHNSWMRIKFLLPFLYTTAGLE